MGDGKATQHQLFPKLLPNLHRISDGTFWVLLSLCLLFKKQYDFYSSSWSALKTRLQQKVSQHNNSAGNYFPQEKPLLVTVPYQYHLIILMQRWCWLVSCSSLISSEWYSAAVIMVTEWYSAAVIMVTGDCDLVLQMLFSFSFYSSDYSFVVPFQIGRLKEMVAIGMNVDLLQKNGILVDTEQDDSDQGDGSREAEPAAQPKHDR